MSIYEMVNIYYYYLSSEITKKFTRRYSAPPEGMGKSRGR